MWSVDPAVFTVAGSVKHQYRVTVATACSDVLCLHCDICKKQKRNHNIRNGFMLLGDLIYLTKLKQRKKRHIQAVKGPQCLADPPADNSPLCSWLTGVRKSGRCHHSLTFLLSLRDRSVIWGDKTRRKKRYIILVHTVCCPSFCVVSFDSMCRIDNVDIWGQSKSCDLHRQYNPGVKFLLI